MPSSSASIRSLAAELGLSRTTVSDALRGLVRVRPDTAKRVWEAATSAGYRPNPLASALMSEIRRSRAQTFRGGLAAVDLDEADRPFPAARFHEALIEGARRRASELGYKLQSFLVGQKGVALSRLDTILQSRGIQGVLILPSWQEPDFSKLDWSRYAGVYTDYIIERPALHAVCCDHYRSMTHALHRLAKLGYKRPGIFLHRHHDERLQHRWEGAFMAHQKNHGEGTAVPPLIMDSVERAVFLKWFKRYKPDVVLGHTSAAVEWIEQAGLSVPGDVGFFCLNVTLQNRPCAGLDLQPPHLGALGIEHLIAQLQRNERGVPAIASTSMMPALWIDGPTLRSR